MFMYSRGQDLRPQFKNSVQGAQDFAVGQAKEP